MQLRHAKNLAEAQNGIARVHALAWSPNSKRLALADHGRFVHLFDEQGERRDRFSLKPADSKGPKSFVVKAMAFSPDSIKLAIAQSDFILFVYKLGVDFGERKSICNKVPQSSAITCMCWPGSASGGEIIAFGTQEGKVKVAILKTNKAQTLFAGEQPCVSICSSPDGSQVLSGHQDGAVFCYTFDAEGDGAAGRATKIIMHSCVPYAISWGESIAVGGSDCKISLFDRTGHHIQSYEYPRTEDKDISQLQFNPSGHCLVAAAFNKLRVFNYNIRSRKWDEGIVVPLQNAYTITAVSWKADGSRVTTGTLCGAVDLFDAHLRRFRLRGAYDLTYVSHNQVIVQRINTGARMGLRSATGTEVQRVNIHKDRFLVAHTQSTLLIGDLNTGLLSEVPWQLTGKERFVFDNPQVCMVFVAGELCLVEYGKNEILGTCRTDEINPHRMSVQIRPASGSEPARKTIAYLMNRQEIQVDDLTTGVALARIQHPFKVDWLELNHRGAKLLFRDKQSQLFLFDFTKQVKTTLLNFCSYVQWVPNSDVVVAQNRSELCVWYNIDSPDRVTVVPIKGEVIGIERGPQKTEVIVDEGVNTVAYGLDESLIEFGTAMEDRDYDKACDLLDQIAMAPETEAMWHALSVVALQEMKLYIAERCYAALGDVAKANALKTINKLAANAKAESGGVSDGYDHFTVRAELAVLNKDFKRAEQIYLDNGQIDAAIAMWQEMGRNDEAIAVAESRDHPDTSNMRSRYFDWLTETGQQEKAGELREREGKYNEAINLYLRGGVPARAAHVVSAYQVRPEQQLLEAIASALFKAAIFEKAGDFFEKLKMDERAIDAYKKGHCFSRAVELARRVFPQYVEGLEDAWGDYLVSQKQVDQAINHYIEAKQFSKAIQSAITSRQWTKAVNIIETQSVGGTPETTNKYYKQIALHYEEAQQLSEAEKYFIKGGYVNEAVEMYSRRGMSDPMYRVAQRHLSQKEMTALFVEQAKALEAKGDLHAAERIYLKVNEPDNAIIMYKKARDTVNMIRLVAEYRPDYLLKTHLSLASQAEKEGNLKAAEQHFVAGKDWGRAVNMYGDRDQLDDAVRVAKVHGGAHAAKQFVLSKAMARDPEEGVRLLIKYSYVEAGIEAALEASKFDVALTWSQLALPGKLPHVFLKQAMHFEDQGEFRRAEDAFIKAGKPKEAVDMYIHQHDFDSAMRIAESHDPTAIATVATAQGRALFAQGRHKDAEAMLVRAGAPELLFKMYRDAKMLNDAQRVARDYCPDRLGDISREVAMSIHDPLQSGAMLEDSRDYEMAIDAYLKASRDHTTDANQLIAAWSRAVRLATTHARHLLKETLAQATKKMVDIGRPEEAGKLLEQSEDYKGAITVYVKGQKYDLAENLARRINSKELLEYIERAKLTGMIEGGGAPGPAPQPSRREGADNEASLKAALQEGDFETAMQISRKLDQDPKSDRKDRAKETACIWVQALVREGDVEKALAVITRDGMLTDDFRFFDSMLRLAQATIMKLPNDSLNAAEFHKGFAAMVPSMRTLGQPEDVVARAEGLLNVLHIFVTERWCRELNLPEMAVKLMLGLPRYVNVLPADKAYFEAGRAARQAGAGYEGVAFLYFSRYLDIIDKMEEGEADSSSLDNTDFATTDFPFNFSLPSAPTVDSRAGEEANQWVLAVSIEKKFDPSLPTVKCPNTGVPMFAGALRSPAGPLYSACCITGYPILSGAKVQCRNCNRPANQEDWNRFVLAAKVCPWCLTNQNADFKM